MAAPFVPIPRRQTARKVGRFVAGRELDGQRRTDARWNQPGTQAKTPTGHASRWAHYPHRRRAGIRVGLATGVGLIPVGLALDVADTLATVRVGAWGGIGLGIWAVWEKSRRYVHRRELVAPLAETLAQRLGDARYQLDPRTWIHVPVDVQERPTRIYLPATFDCNEAQERALVRLVSRKIGLVRPSHTLDLRGVRPYLELIPAPAPREVVPFSDPAIRALVDASTDGHPLLGLAPRDAEFTIDLDAESPHVGMSMSTGAGKSVAGRALIAQVLHNGGVVLVLDRKVVSQAWCDGLPGVRYARTPQEIHDAMQWVSEEIDRRYQKVLQHADLRGNVDPTKIGPRFLLVIEELNTLEQDMRAWWRDVRQTGESPTPPALSVIGRFAAMGRQARMHMVAISQKLTCQSIGGPAARENLSTRVLGRATTSTWNMLAPECKVGGKYPRMLKIVGRVYVVFGVDATPVQVLFMDEEEARSYAMSGIVSAFPTGDEASSARSAKTYGHSGDEVPHPGETLLDEAGDEAGSSAPDLVTLADAAERLALTLKKLRNARERDPHFPEPIETPAPGRPSEYRFEDLELWAMVSTSGSGGDAE